MSTPEPSYRPGLVFFERLNDEYAVYKVLEIDPDDAKTVYVRSYWPATERPNVFNWREGDLRTACEPLDTTTLIVMEFLDEEPVSDEDREQLANFRRIQAGIQLRAEKMGSLVRQADELVKQHHYEEAAHLYTEAASYSKFFFQLFDKRGYCYLKLNRFSEAIADLEHSLSIFPEGKDTLYQCATAYYLSGNYPKAAEKLKELFLLDTGYEAGLQLLKKVYAAQN